MTTALVDSFGRRIEYLRLSVTDRCNYRCFYCMPAAGAPRGRHEELLRHEELARLVSAYPILRIWQVNQPGYQGDDRINLADGGVRLLVIRRNGEVEIESLGLGAYAFLKSLQEDAPLGTATEAAIAVDPGFDLAMTLFSYVQRATLVGFDPVSAQETDRGPINCGRQP